MGFFAPGGYADRLDAGSRLATSLTECAGRQDVVVLALPRGGVPVGAVVASTLRAPLDVFIVRKLGAPWNPELAVGALGEGGIEVRHEDVMRTLGITAADLDRVAARERLELERRATAYRGTRPRQPLTNRTVILVDDGLATGATMEAAVTAVRRQHPSAIVVAVPVGAAETVARLRQHADAVICPLTPVDFRAVGEWYRDFSPTSDVEVRRLLSEAATV